ncbi:GNAT family N-acetyltransferase [Phyllobacterium sp. 0TCS1.6A]|jgi:ribosomal protein S18 acetylase RimI-like enzyme|uniref:GNAT family N-acetyltransferase n=1 Tax=Phyllobacterium sp. 0TCS1.6A TaxID=2995637 RepID=UPI002264D688|nr:GNAT family N-acetyltransferase [Phyllobacterium sp. 0TCS1.6A]MCX8293190.1 GNAT family N-acetyltransferase [Phyllobacterium sp. 0TCS1.6A]
MKTHVTEIRRAAPADAVAISAIHMAAWKGAYSGIIPHKTLNTMLERRGPEWWRRAIMRSTQILLADVGGIVAGYATLGPNRARQLPQRGEIYELYVRPEYQGTGIGSRLMAAARQNLAGQGLKGTVVWALEDNELAIAFYIGAGGRDIAEGVECFEGRTLRKVAFAWS